MPWRDTPRNRNAPSGWAQAKDRRRVLERDRFTCYLCGKPASEVDHVLAVAEGGSDTDQNKAAICTDCHKAKTQDEARRARARKPTRKRAQTDKHPGLR